MELIFLEKWNIYDKKDGADFPGKMNICDKKDGADFNRDELAEQIQLWNIVEKQIMLIQNHRYNMKDVKKL